MRIAFLEHLSEARSPEEFAQTAAGFSLLQLYNTIKIEGFDDETHGRTLESLSRDVHCLPVDPPISRALLAIIASLPFWSLNAIRSIGRRAVYESLLQYGKCLADESAWGIAAEIYGVIGVDAEHSGDVLTAAAARFRCGLASRRCADWEVSFNSYRRAYELALGAGDFHLALRAQIGEANNMRARGDLPGAERKLRGLVVRARALSPNILPRIALARAGLANSAGRHELAVTLAYDAFTLAGDDSEIRYQVLVDLANFFADFGLTRPAQEALALVATTAPEQGVRVQAAMNLMWLAMEVGNEAEFNELNAHIPSSEGSAYQRTQYELLLAQAFRRFGRFHDATDALARATTLAKEYQLHQLSFQIEDQVKQLAHTGERASTPIPPKPAPKFVPSKVRRIAGAVSLAVSDLYIADGGGGVRGFEK